MRQGHSQWWDGVHDGNLSNMKSLTRSSTDRKLSGVSGGLAQYFDVDPILFRVGFVAAHADHRRRRRIAYLALMAFVPSDDAHSDLPRSPLPA